MKIRAMKDMANKLPNHSHGIINIVGSRPVPALRSPSLWTKDGCLSRMLIRLLPVSDGMAEIDFKVI